MRMLRIQVEQILNDYPKSRDDDKLLLVLVLNTYYGIENIHDLVEKEVPSSECITRMRRYIQEKGLYEASKEVKEIRDKHSEKCRRDFKKE